MGAWRATEFELGETTLSKKLWEIGTLDLEASLKRICYSFVAVKFFVLLLISRDFDRDKFELVLLELSEIIDFLDLDLEYDFDNDFWVDYA